MGRRHLKAVSLFAGIGGFDLALSRAGVEVVAAVEIDKACQGVLRRHFPDMRGYADVKEVTGTKLGQGIGLIVGGFPCQDVSVAGKRAGLAGERTGLFFEAVRIINETTPQYVVLENVPGLLSSNTGRDMATVLGTLEELGYGVAYRILDARYFGVPQRRRRVFIVASLGDWNGPREILFEPESLRGDSAARKEARPRVAGTLTASLASGGPGSAGQSGNSVTSRVVEVVSTLQGGGKRGYRIDAESAGGGQIFPVRRAALTANGVGTCGADDNQAPAGHLIARTLTSKNQRLDGDTETFVQAFESTASFNMNLADEISPTLKVGSGLGIASPPAILPGVRRLTPTECERLQGFPDGWTAGQSDSQRYRQLGNAVAVPVVEWIARRLVLTDTALRASGDI
jgi:DNA (cytosine-5)-methyltransferase 1